MLTASSTDRPAFHTRSHTQHTSSSATSTPHLDTAPQISQEPTTTPKPSHSGLPRCITTNAENRPILQTHFQEITEWQGTSP